MSKMAMEIMEDHTRLHGMEGGDGGGVKPHLM